MHIYAKFSVLYYRYMHAEVKNKVEFIYDSHLPLLQSAPFFF